MEQGLDFDVVVGLDVGKAAHHAVALDREGRRLIDREVANTEEDLRAVLVRAGQSDRILVVVDQLNSIGAPSAGPGSTGSSPNTHPASTAASPTRSGTASPPRPSSSPAPPRPPRSCPGSRTKSCNCATNASRSPTTSRGSSMPTLLPKS